MYLFKLSYSVSVTTICLFIINSPCLGIILIENYLPNISTVFEQYKVLCYFHSGILFRYSTDMIGIYVTFSYIIFSVVFPTSALSELELKVKYGKGKMVIL